MSSQNLENLSQDELNKILKEEYNKNRKLKKERKKIKKERSIKLIRKLRKQNDKLLNIKLKSKSKSISKPKPKFKPKSKSFQHYYQECIKGKDIPKDAPLYFKKALLKAKKEYEKGIILEKSALTNFAEMYRIKGIPGFLPKEFFKEKEPQIKDFFRKYRNTKVRMILVCLMEKQTTSDLDSKINIVFSKFYYQSPTYINLEETDENNLLVEMKWDILEKIDIFQEGGSGSYFKEVHERS